MTIDATPVVTRDTDGSLSAIPLGDLCGCCVERPKAAGDHLCAKCREDWEEWKHDREGWARWQREHAK